MRLVLDVENTVTNRDGKLHLDPFESNNHLVQVGMLDADGKETVSGSTNAGTTWGATAAGTRDATATAATSLGVGGFPSSATKTFSQSRRNIRMCPSCAVLL